MKKLLLIAAFLFAVGAFALLVGCSPDATPLPIGTAPETTEYHPESLTIEFYNEADYRDMTVFRKYPAVSEEADETNEPPAA